MRSQTCLSLLHFSIGFFSNVSKLFYIGLSTGTVLGRKELIRSLSSSRTTNAAGQLLGSLTDLF